MQVDRVQRYSYSTFVQAVFIFLTIYVFFCIIMYYLNASSTKLSEITKFQQTILDRLELIDLLDPSSACILPDNKDLVKTAEEDYCFLNISINNYTPLSVVYIDWIAELQDKIDRGFIFYEAVCVNNLVIHVLTNNQSVVWPISSPFADDKFTNGLPNLCFPGIDNGFSIPFQNIVDSFLSETTNLTDVNGLKSILYYPRDSFSANIGKTFYLNNSVIECYQVELYCYGKMPVYLYATN